MLFYDELDTPYAVAYLPGDLISNELCGVNIELSATPKGKLLASFQAKDFLHVSRLDIRMLLARAIEYAVQPSASIVSSDGAKLFIKLP